jgi:methionyl-tRNA formyltransferase
MIKSTFEIKHLKNVLLLGSISNIASLYSSIENLGLKAGIVTSSSQELELEKGSIYSVFDKLDSSFKNFVKSDFPPENTLFISLGARWIFNNDIIHKVMNNHLVNFHGSRLPFDAGGGGFSWRILNQDRINNLLVHLVDDGIDTGPIISSCASIFPSDCKTPKDFELFYRGNFESFFDEFIINIKNNISFQLMRQPDYLGSYNPRLNTDINGWIDWNWRAEKLEAFINAFDEPYVGASTFINKKRVRLKKVQAHGGEQPTHPFMAGIISRSGKNWIVVQTKSDLSLIIQIVEDENQKNIINDLNLGDRFYTSNDKLLESKVHRASYGSNNLS